MRRLCWSQLSTSGYEHRGPTTPEGLQIRRDRAQLAVTFAVLFPHLDERQRRLLMAAEARGVGHGGIRGRRAGGRGE